MGETVIEVTLDGQLADYFGDTASTEGLEDRLEGQMRSVYHPMAEVALRQYDDTTVFTVFIPVDLRANMPEETIESHAAGLKEGLSTVAGIPEADITVEIDLPESAEA